METLVEYWTKMFKWNYTATRMQYWLPTIVYSIIYNILFYSTGVAITGFSYITYTNTNPFVWLVGVVFFIAQFTLTARRLHDTNRSAAWMLIALVPVIGWIVLLVFLCQGSKSSRNSDFADFANQAR